MERATIEQIPLFHDLAATDVEALLRSAVVERYPRGRVLFRQGDTPQHLHLLLRGSVELYVEHDGRECGILVVRQSDMFMPAATVFEEPYLNSARALNTSQVLQLAAADVRRVFSTSAEFARRISRALAGHFRMAVREVVDLKCRAPAQRLAAFLLRLADENGGVAELPMSKRLLSARLGITPEHLSRLLNVVRQNGLDLDRHRISVRDRDQAARFCGTAPFHSPDEEALEVHIL